MEWAIFSVILMLAIISSILGTQLVERRAAAARGQLTLEQQRILDALERAQHMGNITANNTEKLLAIMSGAQVRGAWGELNLKSLVEAAGMQENVHFELQKVLAGGDLRPDLVLLLPGDTGLAVDSKVPMAAYMRAMDVANVQSRAAELKKHSEMLRKYASDLSKKAYWRYLGNGAPQFTVLYLPSEALLQSAIEADKQFLDHCIKQNVIPVAGIGLLGVLWTIRASWRPMETAEATIQLVADGDKLLQELQRAMLVFTETVTAMKKVNTNFRQVAWAHRRIGKLTKQMAATMGMTGKINEPPEYDVVEREVEDYD